MKAIILLKGRTGHLVTLESADKCMAVAVSNVGVSKAVIVARVIDFEPHVNRRHILVLTQSGKDLAQFGSVRIALCQIQQCAPL
jgi:hypothetical protein